MHVQVLSDPPPEAALARSFSGRQGAFWLDGNVPGERGRWSYWGADPVEVVRAEAGKAPFAALEQLWSPRDQAAPRVPHWVGYLAYDGGEGDVDAAWFGRYDAVIALDRKEQRMWVVGDDSAACERLLSKVANDAPAPHATVGELSRAPEDEHLHAVGRALDEIARGNIYQVNLTRRWSAPFRGSPLALWEAMRECSPVPYGFYLESHTQTILCRTMEVFLNLRGNRLETRPIKGTVKDEGDRESQALALKSDPKERAEHAMIVDLMRNDLGRVAVPGSVRVEEQMVVEPYADLSHLVSTVACRVREGTSLRGVLEATFPPGSVTGAPKVAATQYIRALETGPRGVYTGAVGFVDRMGDLSLAVAIRTAQLSNGRVTYHAGGGIVEASDPDRELAETLTKARVFEAAVANLADAQTRPGSVTRNEGIC